MHIYFKIKLAPCCEDRVSCGFSIKGNFMINWGFSGGPDSKEFACSADLGPIPESERSPGEGNGNPLQFSCPENSVDKTRWATVH